MESTERFNINFACIITIKEEGSYGARYIAGLHTSAVGAVQKVVSLISIASQFLQWHEPTRVNLTFLFQ